jgi:GGDEF domain-containing protein
MPVQSHASTPHQNIGFSRRKQNKRGPLCYLSLREKARPAGEVPPIEVISEQPAGVGHGIDENMASFSFLIASGTSGISYPTFLRVVRYTFLARKIQMKTKGPQKPENLERREFQLNLFAASAIAILAAGLVLLMYPAVFASRDGSTSRAPQIAFYGFCILSCLLVAYIVDCQLTIHRLRTQIAQERVRATEALRRASADVLSAMPNVSTFDDRLTMEFRRAATAELRLSVMVISITLNGLFTEPDLAMSALGDAASAVSRKLREQDSIFVLRRTFFGVILPGLGQASIQQVCGRISEGLSDVSGASNRFSFKIETVSYPEQTSSAYDLELAVNGWLPEVDNGLSVKENVHGAVVNRK